MWFWSTDFEANIAKVETGGTIKGPQRTSCYAGVRMLSYLTYTCTDTVSGGVGHRVGLHLRIAPQQGFVRIHDARILLALVALRILFIVPEADGELALPFIFRLQRNQVDKPRLFLQNGDHLVAQLVLELFLSFRFHVAFHNACKHEGELLSHFVWK